MARPIKEGMDYFPHDTDAVNDEKVEALRALYGNDGYAFFFILLERIYRTPQAEIDVSDAETTQILARKVGISDQKFKEILATALKWGCFDKIAYQDRGILTSNGIKKRTQVVIEKRESMRDKYHKSKVGGVSSPISDAETTPETTQSKVKKSKVKKSINDHFAIFWKAYPKKKSKGQAEKVFAQINPDDQLLQTILSAIEQAKKSDDWQKESGKYIPYPATWLSAKGWEDEVTVSATSVKSKFGDGWK